MRLRFKINQGEALRQASDAPTSIAPVTLNPADLSEEEWNILADCAARLQENQGTSFRENLARNANYTVRCRKFAQIMLYKLGSDWDEKLRHGQPFGKMLIRCHMTMLERLDRAGRLTDDLTPELVQTAARHEIKRWEAGRAAGKAWAAEHPAPKKRKDTEKMFARLYSGVLFGSDLARFFGAEAQYAQNGDGWLDGFKEGVADSWWSPKAAT